MSVEYNSKLNQPTAGCVSDMEATYAEYDEWSDSGVAETVAHLYKKALQQLEKYKPFEETLVNTFLLTPQGSCSCSMTEQVHPSCPLMPR